MQRLYVVRHGIAVPHGTPGIADNDRPLTSKGERRVVEIAERLKRLEVEPDRIVSSPLPRAFRTAELLAKCLDRGGGVEIASSLGPDTTSETLRSWLETRIEGSLMIVGHNPSFTDLVANLLGLEHRHPRFELKKGGVAAFQVDRGDFVLDWLATPRLLRS